MPDLVETKALIERAGGEIVDGYLEEYPLCRAQGEVRNCMMHQGVCNALAAGAGGDGDDQDFCFIYNLTDGYEADCVGGVASQPATSQSATGQPAMGMWGSEVIVPIVGAPRLWHAGSVQIGDRFCIFWFSDADAMGMRG